MLVVVIVFRLFSPRGLRRKARRVGPFQMQRKGKILRRLSAALQSARELPNPLRPVASPVRPMPISRHDRTQPIRTDEGRAPMNTLDTLDTESLRTDVPDFRPGDTLKVHVRVVEGNRSRIQVF